MFTRVVIEEPVPMNNRKRIAELAAKYRVPTMFPPSAADAGGLIAYGTSFPEGYRHMARTWTRSSRGPNRASCL